MAARINKIKHDEQTRAKIQAGNLITYLQEYVYGNRKMEAGQVTAALGLLRKCVPDLTSAQHTVEVTKTYVHRTPAPAKTTEEWATQHAPTIQ
jgi:hypothetical protein